MAQRDDKVQESVANAWATIIRALGYDAGNAHFAESPMRVARFMASWHTQAASPPKLTYFPNEPRVDEMVIVGRLPFYSMCAHHGVPFHGHAVIGYIPRAHVLGLSKFARVLDHFAHRFTTQEVITEEVAHFLEENLSPVGLGVVLDAEHLCMSMRGVNKPGHSTRTCALRGAMRESAARAEFFSSVQG